MQTVCDGNGLTINGGGTNETTMDFNLNSLTYGPIIFQPGVPETFLKLVVPGSKTYFAEGNFGQIMYQEINVEGVSLFYNFYNIAEDLALDFKLTQPILQSHIALKNENRYDINGLGAVHLKQGQFNMICSSSIEGTYYLEHSNEYRTINIYYGTDQIEELLPYFPFLKEFMNASVSRKPLLLFQNHRWMNARIMDIIDSMLQCSYQDSLRQLYFEYKIKELLLLMLTGDRPENLTQNGFSKRALESIHEAKYIIETKYAEHITLRGIARHVGMSEVRLKAGFKALFGIGMFDYLLQTRMQKAKNWLLESDKPIKAIATLTGYATKQSFLTAFKNFYSDTPGSFRKI